MVFLSLDAEEVLELMNFARRRHFDNKIKLLTAEAMTALVEVEKKDGEHRAAKQEAEAAERGKIEAQFDLAPSSPFYAEGRGEDTISLGIQSEGVQHPPMRRNDFWAGIVPLTYLAQRLSSLDEGISRQPTSKIQYTTESQREIGPEYYGPYDKSGDGDSGLVSQSSATRARQGTTEFDFDGSNERIRNTPVEDEPAFPRNTPESRPPMIDQSPSSPTGKGSNIDSYLDFVRCLTDEQLRHVLSLFQKRLKCPN